MPTDHSVRTVPEALPLLLARRSPLTTPVRDPLTPKAGARGAVTYHSSWPTETPPCHADGHGNVRPCRNHLG